MNKIYCVKFFFLPISLHFTRSMNKILAVFRPKGKKSNKQRSAEPIRKVESQPEPTSTSTTAAPPPPHLPALDFSPPLTTVDLARENPPPTSESPSRVDRSPPYPSTSRSSPSLPQLQPTSTLSPSVIPPTPIEPSPLSRSISRSSTPPPPLDSTPIASSSSLQPLYSSPSPAPSSHLIPPPSPNLGRTSRSGSPARRGHHRRSSSTGSRSFRETLNAYAVEDSSGQRFVNQYKIGTPQGPLGRGTYAVVEKAVDRETNTEYVSFSFLCPISILMRI